MLTIKDYAKYPFLKGSANALKVVPDLQKPIIKIIETDFGKKSIEMAKSRLSNALYNTKLPISGTNNCRPEPEIASFFFARVLLSIQSPVNKAMIEKFVVYETNRFYNCYINESFLKKQEIEKDLQIISGKTLFTLKEYIPIAIKLIQTSAKWKLVNMPISHGIVNIAELTPGKFNKSDDPKEIFFKEQIKYKIRSTLPMKLDKETKDALDPIAKELFGQYYKSSDNIGYGEVTKSNFPPCIQHIIDLIQAHENPTHMGRFAMVSFLNEIGMSETDIALIFQTVRDFDLSQTIYQIEHISGKQGTPAYKCPACDTMQTNGLCLGKDNSLCKKVKHPLGYYQAKHKFSLQQNPQEKK
jgi:DNA primase large subunit